MKIYPALDLMNGACVRLTRGLFNSKKVYDEDPVRVLAQFEKDGAESVHVVDLDGARDPSKRQTKLLETLAKASKLKIQSGGGIRSLEDAEVLLSAGIERVVVGTLAAEKPGIASAMFDRFGPDRVTLAMDLFTDPIGEVTIATRGWLNKSEITLEFLMETFLPSGLKRVLCTDISKDGMLAGPNIELYRRFSAAFPQIELQASGGVSSLDDLLALKNIPVHSAVVGKAIYEGGLDLAEAIRRC